MCAATTEWVNGLRLHEEFTEQITLRRPGALRPAGLKHRGVVVTPTPREAC